MILPFAGLSSGRGKMNLFAVATVGALSCNSALSAIAYAVGRHGGRRAVERWGEYLPADRARTSSAPTGFSRALAVSQC